MKRLLYLVSLLLALFCFQLTITSPVYASEGDVAQCPQGQTNLKDKPRVCCPDGHHEDAQDCFVTKYINPTVKILSTLAGIAIIAGIVMGGIQYSASNGDPQKTAAGKAKIVKSIYSLIVFMFLFAGIQFMSPGALSANSVPTGAGGSVAARCSKSFLGIKPWFAYLPDAAFASGTCDITNFKFFGSTGTGEKSQLLPVVLAVVDALVRVAGVVAVAFVITGGIKLVTSQGEPEKAKSGRETIINALVGVVIAIIAASIVTYIGGRLSS